MFRPRRLGATLALLLGATLSGVPQAAAAVPGTVHVTMTLSAHPVSGSSFTFTPGFPTGFVMPVDATCSWELAWGSDNSLRRHQYDETYGSVLFRGKATDGYCDPWTITLPYSASRQWLYDFGMSDGAGTYYDTTAFDPGPDLPIFVGSNGSPAGTGLTTSNLPGVWLSLPHGTLIGDRVTATAHPVGGYVMPPGGALWEAGVGTCGCPVIARSTNHRLTFTFTVTTAGTIVVGYNDKGESFNGDFAGATIDPTVKKAIRVTLSANARMISRTTTTVTARTYGFTSPVTYVYYVDGRKVFVGRVLRLHLTKVGPRTVSVIATDHSGHRSKATMTITVVPSS